MTYRRTRWIYQVVFFAIFCILIGVTVEGWLDRFPVQFFLNASPLSGLITILSQHNLDGGMFLGVIIAAATLFLGRFFCGWICPMGACQHFGTWLFRDREKKVRYTKHTYSRSHLYKYMILITVLVCAAFGLVLAGWFDPISLITRFAVTVAAPLINLVSNRTVSQTLAFNVTFLTSVLFIGVFLLNIVQPRFWCRTICPLGALLSLFSLKPYLRMFRDNDKCIHCGLCHEHCQGACEIDKKPVVSDCLTCMNCVDVCPVRAISVKHVSTPRETTTPAPTPGLALTRRDFVVSAIVAVGTVGALRNVKSILGRGYEKRIRPPGALAEEDFLARCIRCGACMKACPTNVIQPAKTETDAEGLWTPVLNMEHGYCEYDCTLCSQVCPTGALRRITVAEKHEKGFGKIGTACVDRTRCLPWAYGKTCLVCQEVCPVSPKAIFHQKINFVTREGKTIELLTPVIDPAQCIGCGACQANCPVQDLPAIRVTSIGESRSPQRKLTL